MTLVKRFITYLFQACQTVCKGSLPVKLRQSISGTQMFVQKNIQKRFSRQKCQLIK